MPHRKIIENNLAGVLARIKEYENKYSRQGEVKLLAVSKTKPIEDVLICAQAGQISFGENYIQDAMDKIQALGHLNLDWHFIGDLQSNKTKQVAENFAWFHTLHREKIAKRLDSQLPDNKAPLNICIEVNIDAEANKSGIGVDEVLDFAQTLQKYKNLKLRGLMCIPKAREDFAEQRQAFARMREIFLQLKQKLPRETIDTLSMGMSNDLEAAIAEGATLVRVGTDIFGARN